MFFFNASIPGMRKLYETISELYPSIFSSLYLVNVVQSLVMKIWKGIVLIFFHIISI
jgi:hypothetical protein